jgi:hypothetical protein
VQDTWTTRELPVLDATVSLLEESYMVTVSDIATRTGLDSAVVARSLEALDPVYVDFRKTTTGGDPTFWYVLKVTPQARRAVGQWPTPDSFVTKLAAELSAAASQEEDAERKGLLSYAARLIGDTLRAAAVRAAGQVLAPAMGPADPATPQLTTPAAADPAASSPPASSPPASGSAAPGSAAPGSAAPGSAASGSAGSGSAAAGPAAADPAVPRATDPAERGQAGGASESRPGGTAPGSAHLSGEHLTPPGPWVTRATS